MHARELRQNCLEGLVGDPEGERPLADIGIERNLA
jgi:hypothetical protein